MGDDPVAVLLKFGFLLVLYLFLLFVARSSLKDLRRTDEPGFQMDGAVAGDVSSRPRSSSGRERDGADGDRRPEGAEPRLEVIAASGHEAGAALRVDGGATLGRSPTAEVRIDDAYASSAHARIFPRGSGMYIEDMGSTNGTLLNGLELRRPQQLKPADSIRIGDNEFRYQE
jgi:hypothetical protein